MSNLVFKRYFVVSGRGLSSLSPLNAFDRALLNAGIAQCNIVPVSSIIPPESEEVEFVNIPPGTVTFVVMARCDGKSGDLIGAGLAWAKTNGEYGFVAEDYGFKDEETLTSNLKSKIKDMAEARGFKLKKVKYKVATLKVPENMFGCVIVALVFA